MPRHAPPLPFGFLVRPLALTGLLCLAANAAPEQPEWQVVKTRYPTADLVVAGFGVREFGAKGDGRTDCTQAFQAALDSMHDAGGGTVFVRAGRYLVKGSLTIPVSVTLRGEWKAPSREDPAVRGTILMPFGGNGDPDGKPFITVDYCAGIKDLNIWYPAQSHQDPQPYPFCLIQEGGDNATFENLTLVNLHAFRHGRGIRLTRGNLRAYNLNFDQPGNHLASPAGKKVVLTGTITVGDLSANGEPVGEDPAGPVKSIGNIRRATGR